MSKESNEMYVCWAGKAMQKKVADQLLLTDINEQCHLLITERFLTPNVLASILLAFNTCHYEWVFIMWNVDLFQSKYIYTVSPKKVAHYI